MKTFKVVIKLTRAMLMNNGAQVGVKKPAASKKQEDEETTYGTAEEQAARTVYWNEDKSSLCIPATNIHSAIKGVSGAYKSGKKSIKEFVAGSVAIEPDLIPLGTKKYGIDTRRVVIQKKAILRCRGKIPEGQEIPFNILVEDDFPDREPGGVMKQMLEEAGRRKGIGDFRPEKGGPFGKFVVTEFREVKGR
jgi:hypothetical protein